MPECDSLEPAERLAHSHQRSGGCLPACAVLMYPVEITSGAVLEIIVLFLTLPSLAQQSGVEDHLAQFARVYPN